MYCYHSTVVNDVYSNWQRSAIRLLSTIERNRDLSPKSYHVFNGSTLHGLCVTRSRDLAFTNRTFGSLVLELKQDQLRHHNRVLPIDGNVSFNGKLEDSLLPFQSNMFAAVTSTCRDRSPSAAYTQQPPMAEELVIGQIRQFRRCINHIYLLSNWNTDPEAEEVVEHQLESLGLPYTVESNPHDIRVSDIIRIHSNK